MRWRTRRRGLFEGPPRAVYRRAAERYFESLAPVVVLNGLVVSAFALLALLLYVDLEGSDLALFAAVSAAGFLTEGALAAAYVLRAARPAREWLAGGRPEALAAEAWAAAA